MYSFLKVKKAVNKKLIYIRDKKNYINNNVK